LWSSNKRVVAVFGEAENQINANAGAQQQHGRKGVEKAIDILADEIKISLKLMGLNSTAELQKNGAECVKRIGV